jgi:thiol-disulfide isomerase/thioredoxin|tara:strand:- start:1090 stop:1566 length:477 start_codon:yes stop_codon:yes gene_type:complete
MAKGFYELIDRILSPYYTIIISVTLLAIFTYVGYLLYMEYIHKKDKIKGSDDVANLKGAAKKKVLIRLFHTDWCPHCQSAMPEWKNFTEKYNNELVKDYMLNIVDTDCSNEDSVRKILTENKVESYPTVKMYKNDEIIDFDAKISLDNLEQFIDVMLD